MWCQFEQHILAVHPFQHYFKWHEHVTEAGKGDSLGSGCMLLRQYVTRYIYNEISAKFQPRSPQSPQQNMTRMRDTLMLNSRISDKSIFALLLWDRSRLRHLTLIKVTYTVYHNSTHSALPSIHTLKLVIDGVYAVDEECTVVKLCFFFLDW